MKILIFSQYFWPEDFYINDVVKSISQRGHTVEVLTGKPNYPGGRIFEGYKLPGIVTELQMGARITRVPIIPRYSATSGQLFLNYVSYIFSAGIMSTLLYRCRKPDIIYIYAPSPLLQALPAILFAKIYRRPVVLNVQDLWPESLSATGRINSRAILYLVRVFVRFIYKNVDLILGSSESFIDAIRRTAPKSIVFHQPNSVVSRSRCDDGKLVASCGFTDGKFRVVFAGNLGSAQALDVLIEAGILLAKYENIEILVYGTGSEHEWMRRTLSEGRIRNVKLMGRRPMPEMMGILAQASALLITLSDDPIFSLTVPNKLQAYLHSGRPVIGSINGEGAKVIRDSRSGLVSEAGDSRGLAANILRMARMPKERLLEFGKNAKDHFHKNYDHEMLMNRLIARFSSIIKDQGRP